MKILHIIKKIDDTYAWQTAAQQQKKEENQVIILLIHDAVFNTVQDDTEVFACQDDVMARGVETKASLVDYEEIVKMLLDADSVVSW